MLVRFLLLAALQSAAPVGTAAPVFRGRARELAVRPPRLDTTVTIDGDLSETPWKAAAVLTDFSQYAPQDGVPAADSTHVLVWYSSTAIHFGVRAFQPREQVRATLTDRDRISQDDHVQILLGTFNDGRQATVFMVNPLGVQADGTLLERGNISGGGFGGGVAQAREAADLSQDFVFQSKGRITAWGYEVELRVPFKSLRYQPALAQTWGINAVRKVQYRGYEDSWAPAQRAAASFLAQSGRLEGLTGLRRGLVVDLTPEATQRTEGTPDAGETAAGAWRVDARRPEVGANIRWGISNNLTLNGAFNPDFSQVEADAGQINFDPRAALSFPEKRPFFLDGLEQFSTPNSLIYTRRVVQPVAAVKLAGKAGSFDLAFLSAADAASASTTGRDHPIFNIIRLQRDVGSQSRIGMAYTDRLDGKNWNRVLDVDGRLVWQRVYSLQFQLAGSATERAGVRTTGPLWQANLNRNGRAFGFRSLFKGISSDFRTQSGFLSRVGQVQANFSPRYTWFGERASRLQQFGVNLVFDDIWDYGNFKRHGDARDKKFHFNLNAQFRGGWTAGASLLLETFGYDPAFYGGRYRIEVPRAGGVPSDTLPFTGTPRLPNRDWVVSFATPQLKHLSLSVLYINGQDENFEEWSPGHIVHWNVSATIRASEQLRVTASYVENDYIRHTNDRRVARRRDPRLKVEYQVNRSVFVRAIGEYFTDYTDALRDDSRTNHPLLVYDASSTRWVRTVEHTDNTVHGEFLFSYKPTPGTVFYVGYGADLSEPDAFSLRKLVRQSDAFFVKASYLFRL